MADARTGEDGVKVCEGFGEVVRSPMPIAIGTSGGAFRRSTDLVMQDQSQK